MPLSRAALSLYISGMSGLSDKVPRDQAVEALRIVAAFAIIAFHAQMGEYFWWLSGLVVFVFLAPFYALKGAGSARGAGYLARRLLVPFAFWYGIYAALNLALGRALFVQDHVVSIFLAGPSWHLWFLPFIFLVLLGARLLARAPAATLIGVLCALQGACFLATTQIWYPHIWQLPIPLPQALRMVPVALLGAGAGLLAREKRGCAVLPVVLGVSISLAVPVIGFSAPVALGIGAVGLLWIVQRFWPPSLSVQPIADCMPGVYLVHIIVLAVAARLVERGSLAQVVIAFALSLAGVWLARRFLPPSRIVLGQNRAEPEP